MYYISAYGISQSGIKLKKSEIQGHHILFVSMAAIMWIVNEKIIRKHVGIFFEN